MIDSDILVDHTRGVVAAAQFLNERRQAADATICAVTAMELTEGCRNISELTKVRQLLQQFVILPVSPAASMEAYRLVDIFFLSHNLRIRDALIAATAREMGQTLYSRNIRHFQMIAGLTLVRPY